MNLIKKTNIDFISKRYIFFAVSSLALAAGIVSVAVKGTNMGLDFTGGTMLQVKFVNPITIAEVRQAVKAADIETTIQTFTGRNAFALKVKGKQENVNEIADKILQGLKTNIPGNTFIEERRDYVGPVVGRDLSKKALFAIILSLFGIIIYVAFRFSNPIWGAAGVIALLHDVFVTFGAMSITNREVDLVVVAALLTIAGYSINDTIVIFDRMRENLNKFPKMRLGELVNVSINETLSRTLITNFTVLGVVAILFFFGGDVINNFAFAMLVGSISGTYSTIAIATPLVYQWERRSK
ncbi:MAG: protein-export membrane protein SecF [Elusimicrobia bacterium RIFOXYA12_FULL_51_18]|nr:MAG: protein-export membrane protein SecF [Elusimicrobia bacterium RIFOXYA12_FULL_51_18]OGS30100.1 MAG: protein-export membrane protein SecF [Elusimicrobia bacterium RIFOXYA2_FULL_53_38]